MPANNFKAFATGVGANVVTQAEYEALTTLIANGFLAGTAISEQLNKVWRQSSVMSQTMGQFASDILGQDVLDNGDLAALLLQYKNAVASPMERRAATAGGTANALTATFSRPPLDWIPGIPYYVGAATSNTLSTPTFTPNSGTVTPKTIVKGNNVALSSGDIAGAGHELMLIYSSVLDAVVLMNPAKGVSATATQIQTVTSSVATNALTAGSGATTYDFRNPTLSNGAPVSAVSVPARSILVPSGATLGTVSGQPAILVLLTAYNNGSPVQCITNLSGGLPLDEGNLISPTTISGSSNSANVIYSASAVSANSPYRVDGYLIISEVTAGTWATDATTKQGAGGQAIAALQSLGFGQTWQTVTRNNGTTYYNTTGRPILLAFGQSSAAGGTFTLVVNGFTLPTMFGFPTTANFGGGCIIIPAGASYSISCSVGTATCAELR